MSVGDPAAGFNYSLLSIFLQLCWAAPVFWGERRSFLGALAGDPRNAAATGFLSLELPSNTDHRSYGMLSRRVSIRARAFRRHDSFECNPV